MLYSRKEFKIHSILNFMAISSAENIFKSLDNKTADVTFNSGMKKAAEVISVVLDASVIIE